MEYKLIFHIEGFPNIPNQTIDSLFDESLTLFSLVPDFFRTNLPQLEISQISLIKSTGEILSQTELQYSLKTWVVLNQLEFKVVPRGSINGPYLYFKESIEKESLEIKIEKVMEEETQSNEREESIKSIAPIADDILSPPTPSSYTMSQPPSPPSKPPSAPHPSQLASLPPLPPPPPAPGSSSESPKSLFKELPSTSGKMDEQPERLFEGEKKEKFQERSKKKAKSVSDKSMKMARKSEVYPAEISMEDRDFDDEIEELEEEILHEKEYEKKLAVDYFNVMNPSKYYPMKVNISDFEIEKKVDRENILTGERQTQKQEEVKIKLEDSLIKVRPIFPGCNVTPTELITNFDDANDELIFYVTPLVNDDMEECRIDFINSNNTIVHSIATPSKVQDPLIARTIAFYGSFASVLPKILMVFGIDLGNDVSMQDFLPIVQGFLGNLTLPNFIGIFGTSIILILSIIIYMTKKPKSTKKQLVLHDLRQSSPDIRLKDILGSLK